MTKKPKTLQQYIEEKYNVRYVGYYDLPTVSGVLIFWSDNPDTSKGHSNYLGVIDQSYAFGGGIILINGISIEKAKYNAILLEDGSFIVSRTHHDYQTGPRGEMVDGGLEYLRYNPNFPITHKMVVRKGKEVFKEVKKK